MAMTLKQQLTVLLFMIIKLWKLNIVDLLVNDTIVVELKAIEETLPIHEAQLPNIHESSKKTTRIIDKFFSKNITKSMKPFVNEYFNMFPDWFLIYQKNLIILIP